MVTAAGEGTAKITANFGSVKAELDVDVTMATLRASTCRAIPE